MIMFLSDTNRLELMTASRRFNTVINKESEAVGGVDMGVSSAGGSNGGSRI